MPGTGMGFWSGLSGITGGLGSLAGLLIDYPAQQRAAEERRRRQQAAIDRTDENAQLAINSMGADAERFRTATNQNTYGMYDSGMADNQRFYDQYFGEDGIGRSEEEARRNTDQMRGLVGPDSTLGRARTMAGDRLNGLDTNLQGLRDSRTDLLQRQLELPSLQEHQQQLKDTADIAGQEAFRDQMYGDLMNVRGASEIAGATSTATRQMADIDAQINRLKAQGRTAASDPQLAALEAQRSQLGMNVTDKTMEVQQEATRTWAAVGTQLQSSITQSRDSLVNALNQSPAILAGAAAGLADAITGTYTEERNFVTQAFQDAVNTTLAEQSVLMDISSTMQNAINSDANLQYRVSVEMPNQLRQTATAWLNQTEATYLGAMNTATQMADAWRQMGTQMEYNFSPEVVELASYFDAAMGRFQQGFNNALGQAQYEMAGEQARRSNELGYATAGLEALNPQVGFDGGANSGRGAWSWGLGG